jgi:A/G-specific adenine glycosylase
MTIEAFQEIVWEYYRQHSRDLPWRAPGLSAYEILVSEMMLQQTQVSRVIPKYHSFLRHFPAAKDLDGAPLSAVLAEWSGLGYNRRAKYLHEAAKQLVDSQQPWTLDDLAACKGVGPNTAAAVLVYAYNQPLVFIETNIRTVFIHHFFPNRRNVSDKEILPLVERALLVEKGKEQPETLAMPKPGAMRKTVGLSHYREWYWALMDYGVFLKSTAGNASRSSRHYTKQSKFAGSKRQIRGQVLRLLGTRNHTRAEISAAIQDERLDAVLKDLLIEGLVTETRVGLHLG